MDAGSLRPHTSPFSSSYISLPPINAGTEVAVYIKSKKKEKAKAKKRPSHDTAPRGRGVGCSKSTQGTSCCVIEIKKNDLHSSWKLCREKAASRIGTFVTQAYQGSQSGGREEGRVDVIGTTINRGNKS